MNIEENHIWHPYANIPNKVPTYQVDSAEGVYLNLKNGNRVIDGMSSWWCMIHGYNNVTLNKAIKSQIDKVSHVMFGGLTHQPAIDLCEKLINLTPKGLDKVFFADSGSVSVEVSLKMALQYWQNKDLKEKSKFITPRGGYHGDTFGAMSVCDPDNGMHHLFKDVLAKHFFVKQPKLDNTKEALSDLESHLITNHQSIAAMILEPIVQGAGGMNIYDDDYLKGVRILCDKYNILLIIDEIATGFGRTGELFGCNHANISPDIMCIGKALTGGYMTMAAVITNQKVSDTVEVLMHGPTFMANPLSCSAANASIDLLLSYDWKQRVSEIQGVLSEQLIPLKEYNSVFDVRIIGAIGVVELNSPLDMKKAQEILIDNGVWLRPYGKLLYTMPPFIVTDQELLKITLAMNEVLSNLEK
ncbi:MAG: adenosylmethionine--8-amino-7-oxononanoate transaminase [Pseudomonadota bacterium]|nr:adenosylmethionine--8-amino-7-oxononanoate transaminase [Pseudomonadota bacterium]